MTLDKYWQKLHDIGWLDYLPVGRYPEIQELLGKALARRDKYACCTYAATMFDTECIDDDHAYAKILADLAECSLGHFRPTDIVDVLDDGLGVAQISFVHDGEPFSCELPYGSDWMEMGIIDLVNEALAYGKCPARFIPLPNDDQILFLAFIPLDVYDAAAELRFVTKKNSYVARLRKRESGKRPALLSPKLLAILQSPNDLDRSIAVSRLGSNQKKAAAAFVHLIDALDDSSSSVRYAALEALPRAGTQAIPILEKHLDNDDGLMRVKAACGLLRLKNPVRAVPVLMEAVRPDGGELIKNHALYDLAHLRNYAAPALPAILVALHDPQARFQRAAFNALQILGPLAEPAIPELLAMLRTKGPMRDDRCHPQSDAAFTLGCIGPAASCAVPDLIAMVEIADDGRDSAISALGMIGSPGARLSIPSLIKALQWTVGESAWRAAEALGNLGPPAEGAAPGLLDLFNVPSLLTHIKAAKTLLVLDPVEAKKAIPLLARDYREEPSDYFRKDIAEIAFEIDAEAAQAHGMHRNGDLPKARGN